MKIHLDNTHSVGLGDHLCLISMLCDMKEHVEVLCNNNWNTYDRIASYKHTLNIPDSVFKLTLVDNNGTFPVTGWPMKLFSPYPKVNQVRIGDKLLDVNSNKRKPCIGLVCYTTNQMYIDNNNEYIDWVNNVEVSRGYNKTFPDCKLRPINYYARVFEYIKTHRYDVLTIDSMDTNFEEKVEMMTRYCQAIIGYEGGVAHLSHMLGIPFFMLNWRLPSPSTTLGDWHCELVHRSKYVHFLKDDDELFKMDALEFDQQIHMIRYGHGNNRTLNGDSYIDTSNGITSQLIIKDTSIGKTIFTAPSILNDGAIADLLLEKSKRSLS